MDVLPGGQLHDTATGGENNMCEAEDAFVGAVLHMAVPTAKGALDLVHDDDLADLLNQRIVTVARVLVAEGVAPDPVAVFARARAHGVVTGVDATKALGMKLGDVYGSVPTPASWRYYGLAVIDEALRRRCIAMGTRVMQAAEGCPLDVLIDVLDAECRVVRRLHDRRLAAATPPRLKAVGA
ncbi:hypothetical protein [Modestobacter sp. DSM 44400]|uniref:hypothetical protein n=1 Tax=Modestobacter sp. DSM 44400 TaxID=1550230 RepID=UPI000B8294C2|nr:hypothetical protein [Modestobacter sp. DSM 44400]